MKKVKDLYDGLLHIYGQDIWHDDALILGTKESLTKLRDAIDVALTTDDGKGEMNGVVADWDGYDIKVRVLENEDMWNKIDLPYSSDIANKVKNDFSISKDDFLDKGK